MDSKSLKSSSIFLLLPTHLFHTIDILRKKKVYLLEEPRYFTDFPFHRLKLAFHRATMKAYFAYLQTKKIDVTYIEFHELKDDTFYKRIHKSPIESYECIDHVVEDKFLRLFPSIRFWPSHSFLLTQDECTLLRGMRHQEFYRHQRVKHGLLMEKDSVTPIGGKWSFDEENRKKMPANLHVPAIPIFTAPPPAHAFFEEARTYVLTHFPRNYGDITFIYPIRRTEALKHLRAFFAEKMALFGPYQDAVTKKSSFLFHSVISPLLNIGILTDNDVIDECRKYPNPPKKYLASLEGFIRQIIGWRNYVYMLYVTEGRTMRKMNALQHMHVLRNMDDFMWGNSPTGLPPIDDTLRKIRETAFANHIERLMFLGNYLLLSMIQPSQVYELFMSWTIDAYDWVMIPNIYGMSQFADGGKFVMTRPYICSSNYILKMSDYPRSDWTETMDALYYNFIHIHEKILARNYATARQVTNWKKKTNAEKKEILRVADKYLQSFTTILSSSSSSL